jgi:BirA family biotin operon repressor/biotin-[acetyl-CoA-carboxylase] ligase
MSLPVDIRDAIARVASGAPWATRLVHRHEVTSTNDVAAELAQQGAPEWTTVVADLQTAGRGRGGRTWHSPEGAGLYVSTVLRPDRDARARAVQLLTIAAGVGIAEGITRATGLEVRLKWPNDVVAGFGGARPRKLAGILAEAHGHAAVPAWVILGYGINLRDASYPDEAARRATSLEAELGRVCDRGLLLACTLSGVESMYRLLLDGGDGRVIARFRELSPLSSGAPVRYQTAAGWIDGRADGVEPDGALRVRSAGGIEQVRSGAVEWL